MYDGDGRRVKSIFNGTTTTYFVGNHYEVTGSTVTKYYYAGGQRIAMRTNGTLNYLLGDHLGSTSLTTDASGQVISELRYTAWGEVRYASGNTPTKYSFTGQFSHVSDFGLIFYNARWLDVSLGRFAQADTIIPGGVQGYDRYAYVLNNPIQYTDPSGHSASYCNQITSMSGQVACNSGTRTQAEIESNLLNNYILPALTEYGASLSPNWSFRNAYAVLSGVRSVAQQIAETLNNGSSASEAFKSVFNTGVNFEWMPMTCEINGYTCWGYAGNYPTIQIYEKYWAQGFDQNGNLVTYQAATPVTAQLIVHELGHGFNILAHRQPESYVHNYEGGRLLVRPGGFVDSYSFGQDSSASEIFADMFVGWAYGAWGNDPLGPVRAQVMTTNIVTWITEAQNNR